MQIEKIKQEIKEALLSVNRDGMQRLVEFLETTDYFRAPASTRFHLSVDHGLMKHHYNVWQVMKKKNEHLNLKIDNDLIIICSLLHDVCKLGLYYKKQDGSFGYDLGLIKLGHAKRSLEIIKQYIRLTGEEEAVIKYHMALFGVFNYYDELHGEYSAKDLHLAVKENSTVQIFASADMESTKMEGGEEN